MNRKEYEQVKIGDIVTITSHGKNYGKQGIVKSLCVNNRKGVFIEPINCEFEFATESSRRRHSTDNGLYRWGYENIKNENNKQTKEKSATYKNQNNLKIARDHFKLRAESIKQKFDFGIWSDSGLNWPDWEFIRKIICHTYGVSTISNIDENLLDDVNTFGIELINKLFDKNEQILTSQNIDFDDKIGGGYTYIDTYQEYLDKKQNTEKCKEELNNKFGNRSKGEK